MEIYNSRTVGFGFVFALFGLLAWIGVDGRAVLASLNAVLSDETGNIYTFVFAVIGGLVSLPVVGRSVEFISTMVAEALRCRADSFPDMASQGKKLIEEYALDETVDPKGIYHLVFYTECDPKLRDWSHRRRNRMYAATANTLAALTAVLAIFILYQAVSWWVLLILALYTLGNLRVFFSELGYHDAMVRAWWQKRAVAEKKSDTPTFNVNVNTSQIGD